MSITVKKMMSNCYLNSKENRNKTKSKKMKKMRMTPKESMTNNK